MLARADDPNFSGPMGFTHFLALLRETEEAMVTQLGGTALSYFGPIGVALAGCVGSAGIGCVVAGALAIAGLFHGGISAFLTILFRVLPDVFDVVDAFHFLDLHCP